MWTNISNNKVHSIYFMKSGFLVLWKFISPLPPSSSEIHYICMPVPLHTIVFGFEKVFLHYHDDNFGQTQIINSSFF